MQIPILPMFSQVKSVFLSVSYLLHASAETLRSWGVKRGLEVVRAESHQTCSGWRGEMGAEDPLHLATPLPLVAITSLFLPFCSEMLKIRRCAEQLSLRCCAEKRTSSRSGCPVRQRLVVTPEPAVGSSPGVTTQGPLAIRG